MKKYFVHPMFNTLLSPAKVLVLFSVVVTQSCEMSGNQVQQGYDNVASVQNADVKAGMDRVTRGGRTIDLNADTVTAGNICYDCNHAQEATIREANQAVGGSACRHFGKFKRAGVPEEPLKQALFFYEKNKGRFNNQRYISIADYSQNSSRKRFYILDMQTGNVRKEKVSHGSGSRGGVKAGDPNHDGMIDRCHHGSNINDRTNMTRAGFFVTRNFYNSTSHKDRKSVGGRSVLEWPNLDSNGNNGLRMAGLSPGVNDEALGSGVVMHGAWYNDVAATMGRSYGCPAFESDVAPSVLKTIRGGTLYYSYTPRCSQLHAKVENQVRGWQGMCR